MTEQRKSFVLPDGNSRVVYRNTSAVGLKWDFTQPNQTEPRVTDVTLAPLQIFSQANSPWKHWLLNFAAKRKGAEVSCGIIRNDSIWDKIFFSKIQVNSELNLRHVCYRPATP